MNECLHGQSSREANNDQHLPCLRACVDAADVTEGIMDCFRTCEKTDGGTAAAQTWKGTQDARAKAAAEEVTAGKAATAARAQRAAEDEASRAEAACAAHKWRTICKVGPNGSGLQTFGSRADCMAMTDELYAEGGISCLACKCM
jgi:hypothetical protein